MSEGKCVFEGLFGEIHIPDLLTLLDMLGKTGTLELRREDELKKLYWQDGEIIFADSVSPEEQITGYLCSNGWLSPEALADAKNDNDAGDCCPVGQTQTCTGGCVIASWLGDGFCDSSLNCEATNWDSGDCP